MRQLTKMGMLLAFGGLLASCSNDNIDNPNVTPQPVEGDGMYMTVNVSLPSSLGTKASFDEFVPGSENEWAVKAIDLYLFELASDKSDPEEEAIVKDFEPIHLGFGDTSNGQKTDVDKELQATFRLKGIELNEDGDALASGGKLYGLLILNPNADLPKFDANHSTFNKWNLQYMQASGESGSDYTSVMQSTAHGFMMSNAPEAQSDGSVITLVEINVENFATSPAEATNSAADFYVQRGVAKVYLKDNTDSDFAEMPVYVTDTKTRDDAYVQVDNWALDVTNQVTFPVQNVYGQDGTYGYKTLWTTIDSYEDYFVKNGGGVEDHIWWAIDPNYFGDDTDADATGLFTKMSTVTDGKYNWTLVPKASENQVDYAYCLENTMDWDQQLKPQTTRVVFKCKYIFDDEEGVGEETWENTDNHAGFIVYNDKAMLVKKDDVNSGVTNDKDGVVLTTLIKEGKVDDYKKGLLMALETEKVMWYPGGETYYVSYIRHFDNDEAELPDDLDTSASDFTSASLGTKFSKKQLGRYGVLRNNIYEMNILGFFGYGSPVVPGDPDEPDDKTPEKEYNALVKINILDWAKRSFNYIPR